MIVCHCKVVTDSEIRAAVSEGARSVSAACRATGAAAGCGSCVFLVKAVVCEHMGTEHTDMEAESAAS